MKRLFIFSSVLLLIFASCKKNEHPFIKGDSESEITLQQYSCAPDTLTFLVRTVANDSLISIDGKTYNIKVKDSNTITVDAKLGANSTFAYPASMVKSVGDKKVSFNLPEYQKYTVDEQGRQILSVPMAGYVADDGTATLYHLCGIKRVTVYNHQKVDINVESVSIGLSYEAGTHFWSKTDEIDLTSTQTITSAMMHSGDPRSTLLVDDVCIAAGDSANFHLMVPYDRSYFPAYLTVRCTQDDLEESVLEFNDNLYHDLSNIYSSESAVIDTHDPTTVKVGSGSSLSGNGTKVSPYLVYNKEDLYNVYQNNSADNVCIYIDQMAGIDASGDSRFSIRLFGKNCEMHYNGRGHTLKMDGVLVYSMSQNSEIRDLTFKSNGYPLSYRITRGTLRKVVAIGKRGNGYDFRTLSGLVDTLDNSNLYYCKSYMDVSNDSSEDEMNAGGLVGLSIGTSYFNSCDFRGSMDIQNCKKAYVGGIVGRVKNSSDTEILYCNNYGSIHDSMSTDDGCILKMGGIVGSFESEDCDFQLNTNYGDVQSSGANITYQGGIAGYFSSSKSDKFWRMCNTGYIFAESNGNDCSLGGLIGLAENTFGDDGFLMQYCKNTGSVLGRNHQETSAGGLVGQFHNIYYRMRDCLNFGDVTSVSLGDHDNNYWIRSGGIIGWLNEDGIFPQMCYVANSINRGEITAVSEYTASWCGGIIGLCGDTAHIINCLNYGTVDTDEIYDYHCGQMTGCSAGIMDHVSFHNGITDWATGNDRTRNLGDHYIFDPYCLLGSHPLPEDIYNYMNDWVQNTGKVTIYGQDDDQQGFSHWSSNGLTECN